MLNPRLVQVIALFLLLAAFAWGIVHLFNLRFAAGDVYPPYSSLRSDPLGCKVFFESLEGLNNIRVARNQQPIEKIPASDDAALFVFGLPWSEMSAEPAEFQALESFVRKGGRLVVTFYPELNRPWGFATRTGTNRPAFKNPLRSAAERRDSIDLHKHWGFALDHIAIPRQRLAFSNITVTLVQAVAAPTNLDWHSSLVFTNLAPDWKVVYARGQAPVMIERDHGAGSIVLATDSFHVSNEAMRTARAPALLAWITGAKGQIIFDETHLGIMERTGIAVLARRYNLHGAVAALIVLALLFIWKNSVSFVPRAMESNTNQPVLGRDSSAGFENILRRSVSERELLQTCLDEWHKTATIDRRHSPDRRERIRHVVEAFNATERPNIPEAYREISRILNRRPEAGKVPATAKQP